MFRTYGALIHNPQVTPSTPQGCNHTHPGSRHYCQWGAGQTAVPDGETRVSCPSTPYGTTAPQAGEQEVATTHFHKDVEIFHSQKGKCGAQQEETQLLIGMMDTRQQRRGFVVKAALADQSQHREHR